MSSVDATQAAPDAVQPETSRAEMVVAEGDKLGRYVVLSRVGAGMMGVVYAAFDPQLDRKVALKVMNPALERFGDPQATPKQMIREARALARIAHPNVVAVYDVGTVQDRVFIAMEFVEGQTLDRWLAAQDRPWTEILDKMLEAGRGLVAAHEQGVVHCDFKPANVIAGVDGRVRVMDFGLARAKRRAAFDLLGAERLRASTLEHQSGIAQGTPAYMAPEQYSMPGDARADQFSFCVATWEALFSRRPFDGDSAPVLLRATLDGEIHPPPTNTEVPAWIRGTLERGLAAFPDARFPSMAALLEALQTDPTRTRRWPWAAGALVVVAAAAAGLWWNQRAEATRACEQLAQRLAAPWSAEARDALASSLRDAPLSYAAGTGERLLPVLDAYATQLDAQGRATCTAARIDATLPAELYERAEACFEERLAALEGVIAGIDAHSPGSVRNAITVAAELPSVEACGDPSWLRSELAVLPTDPEARATAIELKTRLASLVSFHAAADFLGGRAEVGELLEAAQALGWEPLIAEVLVQVASHSYASGDVKAAEDAYTRAFEVATAANRDDLAAVSAAQAAHLLAARLDRLKEAQVWARVAHARAEGDSPGDGVWKGIVANGLGSVAVRAEDWPACLQHFERARSIFAEAYGDDHPQVARAMVNIATCQLSSDRWEEGLGAQEDALARLERALGEHHPLVGITLLNRSHTLQTHGRYAAAQEAADQAHAILTTAYDPHTVEARMAVAQRASLLHFHGRWEEALTEFTRLLADGNSQQGMLRTNRATLLANLGQLDEAEAEARLAIEERTQALGESHPALTPTYETLAEVMLFKGDAQAALGYAQRALDLGAAGMERALVLRHIAAARERLGSRTEAIEAATESLELMKDNLPHDPFVAQSRFVLARALLPDDPTKARALAVQALESLRHTGGGFERRAAEVEAWLSGLDRPEAETEPSERP